MILCIPVSVYLRTSKQFHHVKSFWIPASGIIDFIQAPTACSNCRKSQCITGRWEVRRVSDLDDLDGDFFPHLWLFRIHGLFFFFRGDWGLEASNKYQPTVLEPRLSGRFDVQFSRGSHCFCDPGSGIWGSRGGDESIISIMSLVVLGGLGCLAVQPDKGRWVVFSGCIDEWGQRRSLWGLWKCFSFVIKFGPLCRIFCEHSNFKNILLLEGLGRPGVATMAPSSFALPLLLCATVASVNHFVQITHFHQNARPPPRLSRCLCYRYRDLIVTSSSSSLSLSLSLSLLCISIAI